MPINKVPGRNVEPPPAWRPPAPDFGAMGQQLTDLEMANDLDGTIALVGSAGPGEAATAAVNRFFADSGNADRFSLVRAQRDEIVWTFGEDSAELAAFDEGVLQTARAAVGAYAAWLPAVFDFGPIDPGVVSQVPQEPAAEPQLSPEDLIKLAAAAAELANKATEDLQARLDALAGNGQTQVDTLEDDLSRQLEASLLTFVLIEALSLTQKEFPKEPENVFALVGSIQDGESATATLDRFFADDANAGKLAGVKQERERFIASHSADPKALAAFDESILNSARQAAGNQVTAVPSSMLA